MSKDYGFELQQILSGINHLKGLISRNAADASSVPTIDFAVDMFDRTDQPILDGYWDTAATNWAIRSRKLVPQGVPAAVSQQRVGILDTRMTLVQGSLPVGAIQTKSITQSAWARGTFTSLTSHSSAYNSQTLYLGKFSSPDLNLKLTFDIPPAPTIEITTHTVTTLTDVTTVDRNYVAGNYGLCFGDAANRCLGVTGNFAKFDTLSVGAISNQFYGTLPTFVISSVPFLGAPDIATPDVVGSLPAVTVAPAASNGMAEITFSDFTSFEHPIYSYTQDVLGPTVGVTTSFGSVSGYAPGSATPVTASTASGTQSGSFTASGFAGPGLLLTGNELVMQAVGDIYVVYLNGVQIYTETGAYMTRTRAGIAQFMQSMLTSLATSGITGAGITSFKVWPVGQGQPPDQTGRGTYAVGYHDKYHAADGTYNPLA